MRRDFLEGNVKKELSNLMGALLVSKMAADALDEGGFRTKTQISLTDLIAKVEAQQKVA